jgi:4-methyl-5(b-hydroxyethyl)-thiazole monophosphate biosynthesis
MKKTLLLLADGFEIYEAAVFIDVIGWNLIDGDKSTQLFTCGLMREIRSAFGQRFVVDFTVEEIQLDDFAALAIPGGFAEYDFYRDAYSEAFSRLIRRFHASGKPIFSICTGALPVAKSGVLAGRRGTTYNLNPQRQAALREMGVQVTNEPIVVDGKITTSWNPATAMDVAFRLLAELTSKENAAHVKQLMGFT